MNPIKLVKKFLKILRGGAAPWQITVSCLLGFVVGMTPGFNMTVILALVVFLLLNANTALLLLGVGIGKALCLALAPVTFEIGYVIIHGMGLEGLFRAASETPVIALMDLHYYCLIGGLPVAVVLGGGTGWALGRTIQKLRAAVAAGTERSAKAQKLAGNKLVKILLKILFGKQKMTMAEMLEQKHTVFRKAGFILCGVLVALVVLFDLLFADAVAGAGLKGGLEAAVGAQVDVEGAELSVTQGRFGVEGLEITNPDDPLFNMPEVRIAKSDISMTGLLAKRLVVDELVIEQVKTKSKRDSAGEVFRKPARPEPPQPEKPLDDYFENGDKIFEYLNKARDYLENREESQERIAEGVEKEDVVELAENLGYLKVSARSVLARRPAVTIRRLVIKEIPVGDEKWSVEGTEVSNAPELNEKPMVFRISSDAGVDIQMTFDFTASDAVHTIRAVIPNVSVGDTITPSGNVPIDLTDALVDVAADGTFTREKLDIPVVLKLKNMKASGREGEGALGLDPATTNKMFSKISSLTVVLALEGSVAAPGIRIDEAKTLAALQESLKAAGASMLADMAGQQMKKFADEVPVKLPGDLGGGLLGGGNKDGGGDGKPGGGLLDGIMGGDKKEEEEEEQPSGGDAEKKDEEKKSGGGLLDGLLK